MEPDITLSLLPVSHNFWTRSERRLWLWIMFLGCLVAYAARTVMPVCVIPVSQEFQWNKTDSGTALSAFFWGYATTQILGGYISDRLGGDRVICFSVTGWAIMTVLTPIIVKMGSRGNALSLFVATRALAGCFQGLHFPALSSLFSRKISEIDRGFSFSFSTSGNHFGTILNGCIGSLLLHHIGWSYSFYGIGFLGLLWVSVVRVKLMNRRASSVNEMVLEKKDVEVVRLKHATKVPWVKLLTSSPFWALVLCQFCSSWAFYILLSWMPTYFHENFSHAKGWVFNVVPWALSIPFQWGSGLFADFLIAKGFSTTFTRKLVQSLSFGGAGLFLILLTSAVTFNGALMYMSLAVASLAFHHGGLAVNVQDIAPDFAGSVFGMMNTAGAIPGFIGVYVTGHILEVTRSWNLIFKSTAAVCWSGWIIFVLFASGRRIV